EMEVYENRYSNADVIAQARELLNSTPKTAENETFLERFAQNIDLAEKVNGSGTEAETAIALRQIQAQTESLRAGDVSAKKADLSALYALLTAKEDLNLLTAQSAAAYERAYKNGLYTFMEMSASGAAADAAAEAIRSAIDGLEVCPLITVTTNKVVYQDYYLEKLIDNNQNSICWLQDEQRAGDWVQFRFRVPTALGKVRLLSAAAGSDIIGSADFQISSDGKSWKTVGKLTSQTDQSITFSEEKVLAARILLTSGKGNWLKMNEIIFNDTVLVDTARLETATRKSVDEFAYTPASYEQYAAALAAAREVLLKSNPTQSEIDSAEQALTAAYGNLVAVEPGDKSILERTVAAAEQLVSSGWVDSISAAECERFTAALDRSKAVLADKRAGQPSINSAEEALRKTMPDAVVAGDANGDGTVNIADVLCMRKHLAGADGAISIANADIDGNGRVEVADVLAVRAALAGQN
ncbi:MAG: dockerin type I domain-containing protein, partial [Acutalibacteraceae bacterium]